MCDLIALEAGGSSTWFVLIMPEAGGSSMKLRFVSLRAVGRRLGIPKVSHSPSLGGM
jgi:hypothetical protein